MDLNFLHSFILVEMLKQTGLSTFCKALNEASNGVYPFFYNKTVKFYNVFYILLLRGFHILPRISWFKV